MYNYKRFYLTNEEIKLDFLPINKKITHLFIEGENIKISMLLTDQEPKEILLQQKKLELFDIILSTNIIISSLQQDLKQEVNILWQI